MQSILQVWPPQDQVTKDWGKSAREKVSYLNAPASKN